MTVMTNIRSRIGDALEAGPLGRVKRVAVGLVRETLDDDVLGLSAELAYRWLLALFPLAIMIAALSGLIAGTLGIKDPTGDIIAAAGSSLPPEAAATIRPQLERILANRDGALLSLGLVLTIYAASSGMKALIKGLNRAYDVQETRPFWRQILIALALTILLGTAAVVSFVVMVTGQVAATDVAASIGLGEAASWLLEIAPFPLAILALGVASAFLYRAAPSHHLAWRWVLPGVVLFVPGWIAATVGFSFYVANFGSYGDTYGALGGVIILLVWFYLTAFILLVGGELNAVLEREFASDDEAAPAPRELGEPLAQPAEHTPTDDPGQATETGPSSG